MNPCKDQAKAMGCHLVGDLRGALSHRLNIQRRLVYQVLREERVVKLLRLWTHYG
jgi:Txe/YoeB family toxin of Txe-Axe toxin-antitoxin module